MQVLPSTPIDSVSSVMNAFIASSSPLVNFGDMTFVPTSAAAVLIALFSTAKPVHQPLERLVVLADLDRELAEELAVLVALVLLGCELYEVQAGGRAGEMIGEVRVEPVVGHCSSPWKRSSPAVGVRDRHGVRRERLTSVGATRKGATGLDERSLALAVRLAYAGAAAPGLRRVGEPKGATT